MPWLAFHCSLFKMEPSPEPCQKLLLVTYDGTLLERGRCRWQPQYLCLEQEVVGIFACDLVQNKLAVGLRIPPGLGHVHYRSVIDSIVHLRISVPSKFRSVHWAKSSQAGLLMVKLSVTAI